MGRSVRGEVRRSHGVVRRRGWRLHPHGVIDACRAGWRGLWSAQAGDTPHPTAAERWREIARFHLLPLGGYLLATLVLTFPLVLHFGTLVPGSYSDGWQNYWNYWWVARAFSEGRNPFFTPLLYAPDGASLYIHTLNLFGGVVTLPVQSLFGIAAAYNTVIVVSFTLSGYFAYLLVSYITESPLAGVLGGVVYAFSSYHFMQLLLEHANLYSSEWVPAYVLCLIMAHRSAGRRRTVLVLAGALAIVLMMLCDWQYAIFAALFSLCYGGFSALRERSPVPVVITFAIGVLAALMATPMLVPALLQLRRGGTIGQFEYFPATFSADLLSYVVPSPLHSFWRAAPPASLAAVAAPANEKAISLGLATIMLGLIGAWRFRARAAVWILSGLFFFALSLGPQLQFAGATVLMPTGQPIPLPYQLLQLVPGVNISRVPVRFSLMVVLSLAVLAGFGLLTIQERLRASRKSWATPIMVVLIPLLVAEHLILPLPLKMETVPPFYRELGQSGESGTILEWPLSYKRARSLYYQTIHGQPMIGGYLSRPLAYPLQLLPPYRERNLPAVDITTADPALAGRWALQFAHVRWVVVLLDDPRLDRASLPLFLSRYVEPTPIYTDEQMAVYRPLPPADITWYVVVESGWYEPEKLNDGKTAMRWMRDEATLSLWNLTSETQQGELRFEAWSFFQPRRLEILVDDRVAGQWLVSERLTYTLPLTLSPGQHRIALRSLDPPLVPASVTKSTDARAVSIGVANVEVQSR